MENSRFSDRNQATKCCFSSCLTSPVSDFIYAKGLKYRPLPAKWLGYSRYTHIKPTYGNNVSRQARKCSEHFFRTRNLNSYRALFTIKSASVKPEGAFSVTGFFITKLTNDWITRESIFVDLRVIKKFIEVQPLGGILPRKFVSLLKCSLLSFRI